MWLLQAFDGDIHCWDDLHGGRQGVGEGDGGVGHGLPVLIHHHIEISAVHLIYIIYTEKCPFRGVEPQVCAPIVNGVAFIQLHTNLRIPAAHCQQTKEQANPYS